jgi:hypothetical protein
MASWPGLRFAGFDNAPSVALSCIICLNIVRPPGVMQTEAKTCSEGDVRHDGDELEHGAKSLAGSRFRPAFQHHLPHSIVFALVHSSSKCRLIGIRFKQRTYLV